MLPPSNKNCTNLIKRPYAHLPLMITLEQFSDFITSKGLDVLGGDYKRYLYKCVENQDEWALRIHHSVSAVTSEIKELHQLVERVRLTDKNLGLVCKEVVTAMHAPTRRIHSLQRCCLTGAYSVNCIDVSRATKTDHPVIVGERFQYFLLMLYYVHRFEHVVRSMAKSWLAQQTGESDLATLASKWQDQRELFELMYERFTEGFAHVMRSLKLWLVSPSTNQLSLT